jgi:hypothetical protein
MEMLQIFGQYDPKIKFLFSTCKLLSPVKAKKLQQDYLKGKVMFENSPLAGHCAMVRCSIMKAAVCSWPSVGVNLPEVC